jgi:hypothetical protein
MLFALCDLGNLSGASLIADVARERRARELLADRSLNAVELAASVLLDDRAVFEAARQRCAARAMIRTVEYSAGAPLPLDKLHAKEALDDLKAAVTSLLDWTSRRSPSCEVHASYEGDELRLLVTHGHLPEEDPTIAGTGCTRRWTGTGAVDRIVMNAPAGRLTISTDHDETMTYHALMGALFFDEGISFSASDVYTGRPLALAGEHALDTGGVPGLGRAVLRGIRWLDPNHPPVVTDRSCRDLAPRLREWRAELLKSTIGLVSLSLEALPERELLPVVITPPNVLAVDPRLPIDAVHAFLRARGFERPASGVVRP